MQLGHKPWAGLLHAGQHLYTVARRVSAPINAVSEDIPLRFIYKIVVSVGSYYRPLCCGRRDPRNRPYFSVK